MEQSVALVTRDLAHFSRLMEISSGTPLVLALRTLGTFAEQVRMDFPEDLGRRIVEATRLAVMLHLQHSLYLESLPVGIRRRIGGAGLPIDSVDLFGGASAAAVGTSAAESESA